MTHVNVDIKPTDLNVSITEELVEVSLTPQLFQIDLGVRGLPGRDGAPIDDFNPSATSTYSSDKIEGRFDEEVGPDDFNFQLLFENQLSQGA